MPPTTKRKSAMNPVAKAELGALRECTECEESKAVSNKTYARNNKGLRGWSTVCRVCQSVAAAERAGKKVKPRETKAERWERASLIGEMYQLAEMNRNPQRMDEVTTFLRDEILDELNPERSFSLFMNVLKPLVAGWREPGEIHKDIIAGLLSPHRRRLIIATRYSAKSTITGMYIAWRILRDPMIKVMLISRGAKLASRMLRSIRKVYIQNCPMLAHLMPTEDCLDNAEQFQTPQSAALTTGGATLSSFGVSSDLPGYRADVTVADDVEGPSDDTPEKVGELIEKLNELHMINPPGEKIMLGTYQTEFSVYAQYAEKTDEEGTPVWENHRAVMFEDDADGNLKSRWVGMFTDKDAVDWRRSVTTRAWRLHALLIADPSILNERPLKISDIPVIKMDAKKGIGPVKIGRTSTVANLPTWGAPRGDGWFWGDPGDENAHYAQTVAAIDPASGLAARDAIGVSIVSVTPAGFAVIRHLEGVRGLTKSDNMRRCAALMKEFQVKHLIIEELSDGFFGEILETELITIQYPMTVEKVTTGGAQKGRRIIETLAPPMGEGRIVIVDKVVDSDDGGEFVNQLTRISYDGTTGKGRQHDDIVDSLAHAIAHIKGSITSDITSNLEALEQERIDKLRYIPLREGGLGGNAGDGESNSGILGRPIEADTELSMAELLYEEDLVLTGLTARRDALQEKVQEDIVLGRAPLPDVQSRLAMLNGTLKELRETKMI